MLIEQCLRYLPAEPAFTPFFLTDRNPLSGTRKKRKLYRPNVAMRIVHARLICFLRQFTRRLPHATGGLPDCSPVDNVGPHRRHRFFYLIDLCDAYRHVDVAHLADVLHTLDPSALGEQAALRQFLEQYCCAPEGGLATGAPASPDLFNLYAGRLMDDRFSALCRQYDLTYTRYLDDLTFSSPDRPIGRHRRRALRAIVMDAGFSVNDRKAGVYDLAKGPIVITGVGLEHGGRVFLPRRYLRRIRGATHAASTRFTVSAATIHGMMGVFRSITNSRKMNRLERRLVAAYRHFQHRERAVP